MSTPILAAYVSVHSLLQVLDNPTCRRLFPTTEQLKTFNEKFSFLEEFLENYSNTNRNDDIEDMARQIAEVSSEAEDTIDFHVVDLLCKETDRKKLSLLFCEGAYVVEVDDQLHEESKNDEVNYIGFSSFCQDIDRVIEKIDYIKEELFFLIMVIDHKEAVKQKLPGISLPTADSISVPLPSVGGSNTIAIGLDDHVKQIMDLLTRNQTDLQIIPIVGMGGIGKTTLARNVFDSKYVIQHFDVRIWFTISQEYSVHETLIQVLHDVGVPNEDLKSKTSAALGELLHKTLFDRRYLIVMDDLWSTNAWEDFKIFISDNGKKSRIMVTTRILDVANVLGSCDPYAMSLLDDDQTWNLLCKSIVGHESCSTDLEGIGRRIAKGCSGLPLAIVAIGGLLAKSDMTREYWEFVAKNVNSVVNSENEDHCLKVLHLSYNHLPIHLKPCFLYMRVFPEDHEVRVSELIKLWIAEGFIKPIKGREWEEVAGEYLKDLIDRNLIFIRRQGNTGKVKICGIHDLLRDLCIREYHNKLCLGIPKVCRIFLDFDEANKCFLCGKRVQQEEMIQVPKLRLNSRTTSIVGLLACKKCYIVYSNLSSRLRVVRVVRVTHNRASVELLQPTKLRYLSFGTVNFGCCKLTYSFLHLLWNLETLNIDMGSLGEIVVLPSEIWEMTQLRHIYSTKSFILPDPIEVSDEFERQRNVPTILENLQTLVSIVGSRCTEVLFKQIPNLKKLKLVFDEYEETNEDEDGDGNEDDYRNKHRSKYNLGNELANLQKLESLSIQCSWRSYPLGEMEFSNSLKKLKLERCNFRWEKMSMIGKLPNLQVLKLELNAFIGREWNPIEGEFLRLKYLSIRDHYDWEQWGAEDIHFPVLEKLLLWGLDSLKGIPSGIGDIPTLRLIKVTGCKNSVIESAKEILKEQHNYGNDDLQLSISSWTYSTNDDSHSLIVKESAKDIMEEQHNSGNDHLQLQLQLDDYRTDDDDDDSHSHSLSVKESAKDIMEEQQHNSKNVNPLL